MTPSSPSLCVCLFGATGTAGRATAIALRDAGHRVVAAGRTDPKLHGISYFPCRLDHAALDRLFQSVDCDAVISCIASRKGAPADAWAVEHDANLAILTAATKANVPQFILLSAICVQKPRLAFQHAKLAFEIKLRAAGMRYSIVRPTAYFKSLSGQMDRLRQGKPYLMFGDGRLTSCTPISDADLGRFMVECLSDPEAENAVLPIGGPGPALTPYDMGRAMFEALGLPPKFKSVPPSLLSGIATGLGVMGRVYPPFAARAEFARIGHYYATESMLVWDAAAGHYDRSATPSFGSDTLARHYHALATGEIKSDRGDHAVF